MSRMRRISTSLSSDSSPSPPPASQPEGRTIKSEDRYELANQSVMNGDHKQAAYSSSARFSNRMIESAGLDDMRETARPVADKSDAVVANVQRALSDISAALQANISTGFFELRIEISKEVQSILDEIRNVQASTTASEELGGIRSAVNQIMINLEKCSAADSKDGFVEPEQSQLLLEVLNSQKCQSQRVLEEIQIVRSDFTRALEEVKQASACHLDAHIAGRPEEAGMHTVDMELLKIQTAIQDNAECAKEHAQTLSKLEENCRTISTGVHALASANNSKKVLDEISSVRTEFTFALQAVAQDTERNAKDSISPVVGPELMKILTTVEDNAARTRESVQVLAKLQESCRGISTGFNALTSTLQVVKQEQPRSAGEIRKQSFDSPALHMAGLEWTSMQTHIQDNALCARETLQTLAKLEASYRCISSRMTALAGDEAGALSSGFQSLSDRLHEIQTLLHAQTAEILQSTDFLRTTLLKSLADSVQVFTRLESDCHNISQRVDAALDTKSASGDTDASFALLQSCSELRPQIQRTMCDYRAEIGRDIEHLRSTIQSNSAVLKEQLQSQIQMEFNRMRQKFLDDLLSALTNDHR